MKKKQHSHTKQKNQILTASKQAHAKVVRHTKHLLIPHKGNNYFPHIIRPQCLTVVLITFLLVQIVFGLVTNHNLQVLGRSSDITTAELLSDTNAERAKQNEPALKLNNKLSQAAFLKAKDMFKYQYWAHVSPSGVTPWKWLGDVGYNYSAAGENLAKNYPTADDTVAAWMNSTSHRKNILNSDFTDVGFAVVDDTMDGEETTIIVAYYAAPVTEAAVAGQETSAPTISSSNSDIMNYLDLSLRSLGPVSRIILLILAVIAIISLLTHSRRHKLPKAWRKSWRLHHGLYTFIGTFVVGALLILATGSGQI